MVLVQLVPTAHHQTLTVLKTEDVLVATKVTKTPEDVTVASSIDSTASAKTAQLILFKTLMDQHVMHQQHALTPTK